jgi:predicted acetyltransferase
MYWTEPGKHAFILRAGDEPAGFVLILAKHDDPAIDFSVTDFFVMRKFRRQGVGERIARQSFDQFPGQWKVEQFAANQPAVFFWEKVIGRYSRGNFQRCSGTSQWGPLNVLLFQTGDAGGS